MYMHIQICKHSIREIQMKCGCGCSASLAATKQVCLQWSYAHSGGKGCCVLSPTSCWAFLSLQKSASMRKRLAMNLASAADKPLAKQKRKAHRSSSNTNAGIMPPWTVVCFTHEAAHKYCHHDACPQETIQWPLERKSETIVSRSSIELQHSKA